MTLSPPFRVKIISFMEIEAFVLARVPVIRNGPTALRGKASDPTLDNSIQSTAGKPKSENQATECC